MKIIKKIGLFLSAFVPLFLLLIIKEIIEITNNNWSLNVLNSLFLFLLLIFSISGIITLLKTINYLKNNSEKTIKIIDKQNLTEQHFLGYFSLFVLFAVSFEIEMYSMAVVFFIILFLIGIVYIKNDMYFINPLLNILGYSFYSIKFMSGGNIESTNIFFKGELIVGEYYKLCNNYANLFFLKKS